MITFRGTKKDLVRFLACPACRRSVTGQCTEHAQDTKTELKDKLKKGFNK